jgi:hypothetical protein
MLLKINTREREWARRMTIIIAVLKEACISLLMSIAAVKNLFQ